MRWRWRNRGREGNAGGAGTEGRFKPLFFRSCLPLSAGSVYLAYKGWLTDLYTWFIGEIRGTGKDTTSVQMDHWDLLLLFVTALMLCLEILGPLHDIGVHGDYLGFLLAYRTGVA